MKRFALVTAAALITLTGCASEPPPVSEQVQKYYNENVASSKPTLESAAAAVSVGILSDSHAYNAGSWWRQTVVANKVPGVKLGAFESQPGANAAALKARVAAAAAPGGFVIVQAGTNDLLPGGTPDDALAGVEALWDGVAAAGAKPIVALIPPSATRPEETVALNSLLSSEANTRKFPVLDVYTPVANSDGSWKDGLSTDGVHADAKGADLMAAAAAKQLPTIVR